MYLLPINVSRVKILSGLALMCGLILMPTTATAFQDEAAGGDAAGAAVAQPAYPQPELSPEAVEKARAVLAKAGQAYRRATKMTDTVTFFAPDIFTGEPSEQKIELAFYGGTDALVDLQGVGYRFVSVGEKAYVRRRTVPLMVAILDMKGDLAQTVMDPEGNGIIFPHFAFKRSTDVMKFEDAVTRTLKEPVIEGYHRAIIDGEDVHEIYATGSNGDLYITIDPKTYFLKSLTAQYDPVVDPEDPEDPAKNFDGAVVVFNFNPKAHAELEVPDVTIFDTIDWVKVDSVVELEPQPVTIGNRLPRVPVQLVNGEYIRFCEDLTKINILVYFVMDDELSGATMAMAQQLQERAEAEELPIKITAVNTLEGLDEVPDEWRELLKAYVAESGYDFDFAIDFDALGANNHNVGYIPTFMIVDRNDLIRRKYDRAEAMDVEKMVEDIKKILQQEADGTAPTEAQPVIKHDHDHDH